MLIEQPDYQAARNYWKVLKNRLKKEGSESVTKCNRLKLTAKDGKKYLTDVADAETLLRVVQSVPSPKAEPIKLWLAKVGYERLQEMADPEIALNRSRDLWEQHGRSKKWIEQRMSDKVVDVFDAAGIKRPDISILSEEFLAEMKDYQHKNIALEVLKKLLADEIRSRSRTNLVQSKKLMEMLESAIRRYQNKVLTAAEVIEELIHLSKEITESDNEAETLGLTDFEYAFYTAVAGNDSARELMGKDKLRELAVVLTQKVRENATLDWTKKESVRARLMVAVKRTLRLYGYPPDMQMLATETVLKQAEMIAGELV